MTTMFEKFVTDGMEKVAVRCLLRTVRTSDLIYALSYGQYDALDQGPLWFNGKKGWVDKALIREELRSRQAIDLTKMPTRQLLQWLKYARAFGGFYSPVDSHSSHGASVEELKAELAKREHVPNKLEAKELRRQAAWQARRGKSRVSLRRSA